jgi:deazaflavin-dependent oxidoreductase (nitroreductase family)
VAESPFQSSALREKLWNVMVKTHVLTYRGSGGRFGAEFKGAPVLLLDHVGRRSGKRRTNPLMYVDDGPNLAVVASKGGAPKDPFWWTNLKAHPDTTVQVGGEKREVRARQATPEEKATLWPRLNEVWPEYDEYQKRTDREIPVVILEPRAA